MPAALAPASSITRYCSCRNSFSGWRHFTTLAFVTRIRCSILMECQLSIAVFRVGH
jgi:hypothetical protein